MDHLSFVNPYRNLYDHPSELIITFAGLVFFVFICFIIIYKKYPSKIQKTERYMNSFGYTLLSLNVFIFLLFAIAYIFLIKLQLESFLWMFWLLMFLFCKQSLFCFMPIILIINIFVAIIGKNKELWSMKPIKIGLILFLLMIINMTTYIVLENNAVSSIPSS
jgi:hypothetical protein